MLSPVEVQEVVSAWEKTLRWGIAEWARCFPLSSIRPVKKAARPATSICGFVSQGSDADCKAAPHQAASVARKIFAGGNKLLASVFQPMRTFTSRKENRV
jgi:hypothetical protein